MSSGKKHKQKEKKIKKRRARAHTESCVSSVVAKLFFSLTCFLTRVTQLLRSECSFSLYLSLFLSAKNVFNLLLFPAFRFKLLAARTHKFLIYVCHACCDMVWKITLYFNEFALGLPLATC